MYYKIDNFINSCGYADYKGIDLDLMELGSFIYPIKSTLNNICILKLRKNSTVEKHNDVVNITEEEYLRLKSQIEEENKKDIPQGQTLEEKIKTLTENLAQEKVNNMKKDALAMNLTKEVANLKIEVMNLKKGGN